MPTTQQIVNMLENFSPKELRFIERELRRLLRIIEIEQERKRAWLEYLSK